MREATGTPRRWSVTVVLLITITEAQARTLTMDMMREPVRTVRGSMAEGSMVEVVTEVAANEMQKLPPN